MKKATCIRCNKTKRQSSFNRDPVRPTGFHPWCKSCFKKYFADYYRKNIDRFAVNSRIFRIARPESLLLQNARKRSKSRGVPFSITQRYIKEIWPKDNLCPVLGTVFKIGEGKITPESPTLDAFYPDLGYVVGNVHVISNLANTIKQNVTDPNKILRVYEWMRSVIDEGKP